MRGCAAGGGNEPKFGTDGPGQTVSRGSVFSVKRFSDRNFRLLSREFYHILTFDSAKEVSTIADYLTKVHPEDREFVEATINQMVAEEIGRIFEYDQGAKTSADVTRAVAEGYQGIRAVSAVRALALTTS